MDARAALLVTMGGLKPDLPYLSVVATVRNDDHGANLLRRVQTFLNGLTAQARRHALPMELVLVEWNPPAGKPPLADALRWPADAGPCRIRIVTVPPELHARYQCAEALPLYQMIAKNVGIRRAQGEFVLATNIDILFSDELMAFLAARGLEPGRMYRIDRTDVESGVPVDAAPGERLAWCQAHRIRVNAREGTFALTPEGHRRAPGVDIAPPESGIFFGAGWYAPEQHFGQVSRWVANLAEISLLPSGAARTLVFDAVPGPGAGFAAFELRLADAAGAPLGQVRVDGRSRVRVAVPPGMVSVRLQVEGGGQRALPDARTMNFLVTGCAWGPGSAAAGSPVTVSHAPRRTAARALRTLRAGGRWLAEARGTKGPGRVGLPFPPHLLERFQLRAESRGISVGLGGRDAVSAGYNSAPADLHTNACGDFTLAHRRHWLELRGYPEFDLYSMNIDALFCYMAHYGGAPETMLPEPMRVYHIEHATGSGWTPEGQKLLFDRLAAKGIPWLDFEEVLKSAALMERLHTTMIFNREDWGLAEFDLTEVSPMSNAGVR